VDESSSLASSLARPTSGSSFSLDQKAPMTDLSPPRAEQRPTSFERHGITVTDDYAWLRDAGYPTVEDPAVLGYLEAENAYFEAWKKPHEALVETLFQEMKGRQKEDDRSVPVKHGDWLTWWAFEPGAQYRRWFRKPVSKSPLAPSEVEGRVSTSLDTHGGELIYDEVKEAEGKEYFRLGALEVSPDGRLAAIFADDSGSERFTLRIRNLATREDLETVTEVGIGAPVWSADGSAVLFTEVNDQWRSYRARYHRLGDDPANDVTLYEETEDKGFSVGLARSQDESLIFIASGDNRTSEVRFVPAADPLAEQVLISPRRENRLYEADAAHGRLWILTNDEHINFRIVSADPARPSEWQEVVPGSDNSYLRGVTAFRDHLVITSRLDGLDQLTLRDYATGDSTRIPFAEASYTAGLASNPEFAPAAYRLVYSSMVTPSTVFDYDPKTGQLTTLKVTEIPSGYDPTQYATERLMIPARDGKQIPVSVVYKKGYRKDGSQPLFLYAYGAYGYAIPPSFSSTRLSLLDRGFAYAIAHIRGGDDLGYGWYLDGTATKRWNTFNDFVDAAKGLVAEGFSRPGCIAIQGGSAGGKLMGVVANTDPDLWGAVIADVPFVDVVNTMIDDTLPLTPGEWPVWGNPITDPEAFKLLLSYSPYDNVKPQAYPPMLVTAGLHDPRVTYWEPAKWVARLRAAKTDNNLLLLKTNMGAGHGGKSGRWDSLRETAEDQAFVLTQLGIAE
jgi:oligopeptidase B